MIEACPVNVSLSSLPNVVLDAITAGEYIRSVLWSFLHLLQRASNFFFEYMGTNALAVAIGLSVFLLMEAHVWHQEGWSAVRQGFKGSAGVGIAATLLIWASLFGFCIVKVVYDNQQSLVEANAKKLQIITEKTQ
jgi:hypothetical protein